MQIQNPTTMLTESCARPSCWSDFVRCALALEARFESFPVQAVLTDYQHLLYQAAAEMEQQPCRQTALARFLQLFYDRWLFSEPGAQQNLPFSSRWAQISYALTHRTATGVTLGLLMLAMLKQLEFEAEGIFVPGELLVQVGLGGEQQAYIVPSSGETLALEEIQQQRGEDHQKDLDAPGFLPDPLVQCCQQFLHESSSLVPSVGAVFLQQGRVFCPHGRLA